MDLSRIRCEVCGRARNWIKYPESQAVPSQRALLCGNISSTGAWRSTEQGFSLSPVSYILSFIVFSVCPTKKAVLQLGIVLVWLKGMMHSPIAEEIRSWGKVRVALQGQCWPAGMSISILLHACLGHENCLAAQKVMSWCGEVVYIPVTVLIALIVFSPCTELDWMCLFKLTTEITWIIWSLGHWANYLCK